MNESDNYSPLNPSAIQVGGNDLPDLRIYGYQVYEKLSEQINLGKVSYLGIDLKLDRLVVIKEWRRLDLAKPTSSPATTVRQHQRQVPSLDYGNYLPEIERLQQLDHLNIPRYLNSFATPTGFCVVREYQSGVSLAELGDLPPSDIKLLT
jgi:serine/threonine protein kinase